jgi:hypothetical protein
MAHKLELAYKDALSGVGYYKKLDNLLTVLYTFCHKSPKDEKCPARSFPRQKDGVRPYS